jgi:hypothetical protein
MAQDVFVFTGCVTAGKLHVRGWKPLAIRDGEVLITVERARATRSHAQNAWYFGCILKALSDHTGYTVDELHEYCKQRFNAKTVAFCDHDGVIKDEQTIGLSTTKLNKITFGEYCEAIRQWAAQDLDVVIPDPREVAA